jgi:acyl-coenzyme A thioesterase 9
MSTTAADDARKAAAAHRTSVTQHLWKLRESQAPPLRPDGSRLPADSRVVVAYDLTQDKELRNRYESAFGTLRVGRLLEDMDALAGSVAYLHVDDGKPETAPPILVTASMERLEVRDDTLALDEDYNLVGSLVWAGRSSLEIVAELRHKQDDAVALSAVFTFVARKRDGSGGHMVPPLSPETPREQQLFDAAAAIQAQRKAQRQAAKDPSKQAERAAARDEQIEALLKPGRIARDFPGQADEGFVLMHETSLKNAITTQPQVRNTAGRVFGGALMRYALELAFATAYAFSGCAPTTRSIAQVDFVRPVEVGALLALKSHVVHVCDRGRVCVDVTAAVWKPGLRESTLTNNFSFVFDASKAPRPLKDVLPVVRTEAAMQLDAIERMTNCD